MTAKKIRISAESKKKVDEYLKNSLPVKPETIRARPEVWSRVDALAAKKGCSRNALVVALMERACDEEGM